MAESREDASQTLDQESNPPIVSKRRPELDCAEQGEAERSAKNPKLDTQESQDQHGEPTPNAGNDINGNGAKEHDDLVEDEEEDDDEYQEGDGVGDEGGLKNGPEGKGKGPAAVDKGKGKMVVEEDDDEGDSSDGDSDGSSDGGVIGGGGEEDGEDSDFDDDPLAEVDLDNILPSRTRQRPPPPPGAYLVNELDGEDDDEESE